MTQGGRGLAKTGGRRFAGGRHKGGAVMKLAVWQAASPMGDETRAFDAIAAALHAAGAVGCTMMVGPEAYLPGYNQDSIAAMAQGRGGAWQQRLAGLCRAAGCGITLGYAERAGDVVYNAAMVLDAGGAEVAQYRKVQLYGPREHSIYAPGDAYAVFDLNGVKTAVLICYDIEFPQHVAALAARGVALILVPTANMEPFVHVIRHTVPAMAAMAGLAIAYANYCGIEGNLDYVGGSLVADPLGGVMAQAGKGAALLIVDGVAEVSAAQRALMSTQAADFRVIP